MNPLYDLMVIGVIVVMVLINLYSSRKQSQAPTTSWSELAQKCTPTNSLLPSPALSSPDSAHDFLD